MNKLLPPTKSGIHVRAYGFLLFLLLSLLSTLSAYAQATIATDKPDYPPGSTVTITGSGFQANESIVMQVLVIDPAVNDNDTSPAHKPFSATADASGNLQTTWVVPADGDELGATLKATADGQSSKLHAEVVFTDGSIVKSVTVGPQSPSSVAPGSSATYIISVIANNGSNATGSVPLTASGLQSSVTASFNPASVTISTPGQTVTLRWSS